MNKQELIDRVHLTATTSGNGNNKLHKADVEAVIDALAFEVKAELATGGEVTLPGIGKLHVADVAARPGRNPANGEAITIAAHKSPKFKAAKALKDAVNG